VDLRREHRARSRSRDVVESNGVLSKPTVSCCIEWCFLVSNGVLYQSRHYTTGVRRDGRAVRRSLVRPQRT
jgi:hypothetical protein